MGCNGPMSFLRDALWQLPFRAGRRQPDQTAAVSYTHLTLPTTPYV